MKKFISIFAAAAALLAVASCNQNKPTAEAVAAEAVKNAGAIVEAVAAGDTEAIKEAINVNTAAFETLGITDDKYADLRDVYTNTFDDTLAENGVSEDDINTVLKKKGIEIPLLPRIAAPEAVAETEAAAEEIAENAAEAAEAVDNAAEEAVDAIKDAAAEALDIPDEVEEAVEDVEIPFILVERKPLFNGGDASKEFSKWLGQNLSYPEEAKAANVQGRVITQFVVGKDGAVKDVKVLRGVNPALDAEAVRVVSQSPAWTPGQQGENPVDVTFTCPVVFVLN